MTNKSRFIISILTYTLLNIASQYGSSVTVDMSWLMAGAFLPISCFTLIPLLDCARSFSQGCAERAKIPFKYSFGLLVIVPLIIAFTCSMVAGLPVSIFLGALFATGIGGLMDVSTFKFVGRWFKEDHKRMSISNAAATIVGSFIFFIIAFTPLIEHVGIQNVLSRGEYIGPAISSQFQALIVYTCGMTIAWGFAIFRKIKG